MKEITVQGFGGVTQTIQVEDNDPRVTDSVPVVTEAPTEDAK